MFSASAAINTSASSLNATAGGATASAVVTTAAEVSMDTSAMDASGTYNQSGNFNQSGTFMVCVFWMLDGPWTCVLRAFVLSLLSSLSLFECDVPGCVPPCVCANEWGMKTSFW